MNRNKNMDCCIKNLYIISPVNKDDILYKCIYVDFHIFELQILKKRNYTLPIKLLYFQIIDYIRFEPTNYSFVEKEVAVTNTNITVVFKHKILEKVYNIEFSVIDKHVNIKVRSLNKTKITSHIDILIIKKEKYEINNINIINYSYSSLINTKFKLEKIPSVPDTSIQKIPKTIVQTYKTSVVNDEIYNATISWILCNNDYKYEFYDDTRCIEFIKNNFAENVLHAFNSLIPGAYKADLFRYCYMYKNGGVYTDIDNICMCNLKNFIKKDDIFISVKDRPAGAIYNAFIASTPNNPVFKNCIDNIIHCVKFKIYPFNITNNYNDKYLSITGPICLGKALNMALVRNINDTFECGEHNINNFKFKLFNLDPSAKYVTCNNKLIFYVKYNGYQTTSNYITLFENRTIYKN